jgi:hypothetical protein
MANPLPAATADQLSFSDGSSDEQPITLETETIVVPVPMSQRFDELVLVDWFQHRQAHFAARFLSPSFKEG